MTLKISKAHLHYLQACDDGLSDYWMAAELAGVVKDGSIDITRENLLKIVSHLSRPDNPDLLEGDLENLDWFFTELADWADPKDPDFAEMLLHVTDDAYDLAYEAIGEGKDLETYVDTIFDGWSTHLEDLAEKLAPELEEHG